MLTNKERWTFYYLRIALDCTVPVMETVLHFYNSRPISDRMNLVFLDFITNIGFRLADESTRGWSHRNAKCTLTLDYFGWPYADLPWLEFSLSVADVPMLKAAHSSSAWEFFVRYNERSAHVQRHTYDSFKELLAPILIRHRDSSPVRKTLKPIRE